MYNRMEIGLADTPYHYCQYMWFIDGKPLTTYLEEMVKAEGYERLYVHEGTLSGLCPAGSGHMLFAYEREFVWNLFDVEEAVCVPILICEDDLDFSCIVIVVKVRKTRETVYWDYLGLLNHWDEKEAEKYGILWTEAYAEEDWQEYGETLAWERPGSSLWKEWTGKHWEEEQRRRYQNYVTPYLRMEGCAEKIGNLNFSFDRREYEKCVKQAGELFRKL